jgi:hypothetical protein
MWFADCRENRRCCHYLEKSLKSLGQLTRVFRRAKTDGKQHDAVFMAIA